MELLLGSDHDIGVTLHRFIADLMRPRAVRIEVDCVIDLGRLHEHGDLQARLDEAVRRAVPAGADPMRHVMGVALDPTSASDWDLFIEALDVTIGAAMFEKGRRRPILQASDAGHSFAVDLNPTDRRELERWAADRQLAVADVYLQSSR